MRISLLFNESKEFFLIAFSIFLRIIQSKNHFNSAFMFFANLIHSVLSVKQILFIRLAELENVVLMIS